MEHIVKKIDEKGEESVVFTFVNDESAKHNLVSAILMDYLHINIFNEGWRARVEKNIREATAHYVWGAPVQNIHYLVKK